MPMTERRSELLARRIDECFDECSRRTELLAALVGAIVLARKD